VPRAGDLAAPARRRGDSHLRSDQRQAIFFGALLAAISVAGAFHLSDLLTPMGTGFALANGMNPPTLERLKASIDPLIAPLFVIFLVTAGAQLQPDSIAQPAILLLASIYVIAGIAGRVAGTFAVASLLRLGPAIRKYLGLSRVRVTGTGRYYVGHLGLTSS
jgi:hypothetical protein